MAGGILDKLIGFHAGNEPELTGVRRASREDKNYQLDYSRGNYSVTFSIK